MAADKRRASLFAAVQRAAKLQRLASARRCLQQQQQQGQENVAEEEDAGGGWAARGALDDAPLRERHDEGTGPESVRQQEQLRFPALAFYPRRRLQAVDDRVARFLASVQQRLRSGAAHGVWQAFPTQQPAFEYADTHAPDGSLRVFSGGRVLCSIALQHLRTLNAAARSRAEEHGPSGRRRFVVCSYSELWRRYAALPTGARHVYEIIRQGHPCHLYFGAWACVRAWRMQSARALLHAPCPCWHPDLEFQTADNPALDGEAAVDALLALLRELLLERHGLELQDG